MPFSHSLYGFQEQKLQFYTSLPLDKYQNRLYNTKYTFLYKISKPIGGGALKTVSKLLEKSEKDQLMWAMWNWNGRISEHHITEQFDKIVASGFNGILIRPLEDIIPSYLSEEFIQLFNTLLILAEKAGIKVLIADDFTALPPSSFSQILTSNKTFRANRLVLLESVDMEGDDHYEFIPNGSQKEYVIAAPLLVGKKISLEGSKTLFDGDEHRKTSWTATKGTWRVMHFAVENARTDSGEYMPNFFSTKCAQSYTTMILDQLIPGRAPTSFGGIYCEMPPIVPSKRGIPWDDELLVPKYRSRFKKNLVTTIPALFVPVVDSDAKYRPHILNFIHDTFFERFASTCNKWAQSKKVDSWFIGAEIDRQDPLTSSSLFTQTDELFSVTGIRNDSGKEVGEASLITTAAFNKSHKNRHTAIVLGRNSHMKSPTLAELKRSADRAIFNGADRIIIDGFMVNNGYQFSRTTPPAISFSHPDFDKLTSLITSLKNEYSVLSCSEKPQKMSAILFPSQSAMADFAVTDPEINSSVITEFMAITNSLRSNQIPFTVLSEQCVHECKINSDGTISNLATGEIYDSLILPYSRLINNSLFVQLEKFAIKKGVLLFINEAPRGSFDDGVSASFVTRIDKLLKSKTKRVYKTSITEMVEKLKEEQEVPLVEVENSDCEITVVHGKYEDVSLITVLNSGSEPVACSAPHIEHHRYYQLDHTTGKLLKVDAGNPRNENELFPFYVQPQEVITLLSSGSGPGTVKPGILAHDEPDYRIKIRNDRWFFTALSLNSFPLTRWNTRMSIDRNSGLLSNYYETTFELDRPDIESYLVLFDSRAKNSMNINDRFKVLLNGTELHPVIREKPAGDSPSSFVDCDSQLLVYPLQEALDRGKNSVRIMRNSTGYTPDPLNYPPTILVDSPIEQIPGGWKIVKLPDEHTYSWGETGYPYLVGTGQYTINFEVPDGSEQVLLNFENLSGSAEIAINGKEVASLLWPPYRVDVTEDIDSKRNELSVTVKNSLSPLTQLNGKESGIIGNVYLEVFGIDHEE